MYSHGNIQSLGKTAFREVDPSKAPLPSDPIAVSHATRALSRAHPYPPLPSYLPLEAPVTGVNTWRTPQVRVALKNYHAGKATYTYVTLHNYMYMNM